MLGPWLDSCDFYGLYLVLSLGLTRKEPSHRKAGCSGTLKGKLTMIGAEAAV